MSFQTRTGKWTSGNIGLKVHVEGIDRLKRIFRRISESDAPYLKAALHEGGLVLQREGSRRTHPSIAQSVELKMRGTKAATFKAAVIFKHRGAKSREFGRKYYYRRFTKRRQKSGERFASNPGQTAQPFLGIVHGGGAIEASAPRIKELLTVAIDKEWDRLIRTEPE